METALDSFISSTDEGDVVLVTVSVQQGREELQPILSYSQEWIHVPNDKRPRINEDILQQVDTSEEGEIGELTYNLDTGDYSFTKF